MLYSAADWLFRPAGLTAHGFCLSWEPWLIWTQASSDFVVGVAYFTIPIALAVYAGKRAHVVLRPVLWLFAAFILLCGAGHFVELLTLWVPAYRLQSLIKAATGLVSVVTAVAVWNLLPKALALPSPQELRVANSAIRDQATLINTLAKDQQVLHNIVEASPTALVLIGQTGEIVMANAKAESLFGHRRDDLRGMALETLIPEPFSSHHAGYRTAFTADMSLRPIAGDRELQGLRKNGTRFPLEVGLSAIEIDGQHMLLAGINDMTASREAHRAVEERRLALEVSNGELIRARLRAEQATRAKSRFLAGMSHELRTPLNGIIGYAEILQSEGDLNPKQTGRIRVMRSAGDHLLDMITAILDLSEIEAGKIAITAKHVDVMTLVRDCVYVVTPPAQARGVSLTVDAGGSVPAFVHADPVRLRQVVLNLLGNAVKFTDAGSVDVSLGVTTTADAEALWYIEVADTGRGIPSVRRASLFQDFDRLGGVADGAVEGAGLGLAISARIAAAMGGQIIHRDNPGGGSVFRLELPLSARPEIDADAAIHQAAVASSAAGPVLVVRHTPATNSHHGDTMIHAAPLAPTQSFRVLVVDDVAMNRDIAEFFLTAAGHEVTSAASGEAAIETLRTSDVDLVLMDLSMPGMDGFETTTGIRAIDGSRGLVRIMALTAHAFSEHVAECKRAGMVGHLSKPFTQASLAAAVCAAMSGPPAPAALDEVNDTVLPILNLDTYETSMSWLSPEKVTKYLDEIATSIMGVMAHLRTELASAYRDPALLNVVHKIIGSAGLVGFQRLSAAASRFQQEILSGAPGTRQLAESLIPTLNLTLEEIGHRRASALATIAATRVDQAEHVGG